MPITGLGTIFVCHEIKDNGKIRKCTTCLYPVFHTPGLSHRLLSMGELLNSGYSIKGSKGIISLYDENNHKSGFTCTPIIPGITLYYFKAQIKHAAELSEKAMNTIFTVTYDTWHKRLRHPSKEVIRNASNKVTGFPKELKIPTEIPICKGCAQRKMHSKTFPVSYTRAQKPFELIHSDLKSFLVESYSWYNYFMTFLDDFSSHTYVVHLHVKSDAITALESILAHIKTQHNVSVKRWRSDAGGEFKSKEFLAVLRARGIDVEQSVPHTPQQNGRAERLNRTLMDKAQSMRFDACIPPSWWEFTVSHAVWVYNRTPMVRHKWLTPYEILTKNKPDISGLRVFGCGAYVHLPDEVKPNKLWPKSELMIFLSYQPGIKGYLFMRPQYNRLFYAHTALFDETMFPKCPSQKMRENTPLGQDPKTDLPLDDTPSPLEDDDDDLHNHYSIPSYPKDNRPNLDHDEDFSLPDAAEEPPVPGPSRPRAPPAPFPDTVQGKRIRVPTKRPNNIYENRNPADTIRKSGNTREWKDLTNEPGKIPFKPRD
jgi:hypothetical protein